MIRDELTAILTNVKGWLTIDEAYALYELARAVSQDGVIVEIGSYHGRSTIALALGAKDARATVYAIDSHHIHEAGGFQFGPEDNAFFMRNVLAAGVVEQIRVINLPSHWALKLTWDDADLVFIDGAHDYIDVRSDFDQFCFSPISKVKVAIHDSTGMWEGPTRLVKEVLAAGWELIETIDNTSILRRSK